MARGEQGLYVNAEIKDQEIIPIRVGRVFRSDSIGLRFDTNDDGREDANYFLLLDWIRKNRCY